MSDTKRKMILQELLGVRGSGNMDRSHVCHLCKRMVALKRDMMKYGMPEGGLILGGLILGGDMYMDNPMDKGGIPIGGIPIGGISMEDMPMKKNAKPKKKRALSDWQRFLKVGFKPMEKKLKNISHPSKLKNVIQALSLVWDQSDKNLVKAKKMLK